MVMNVIDFTAVGGTERAQVGGKGAHLGMLVAGGFPVPGGFTVSTTAYRAMFEHGDLRASVAKLLGGIEFGDATSVEEGTSRIRSLVSSAEVPRSVLDEIRSAYEALVSADSSAYVAVRSSGTAEDMEGASFAGLHDTYLDIAGADDVIDAVRRCWASLWTARATAYRHAKNFDHGEAHLAVVIQKMVPAEVAGVMFTAHPMTAAVDRFVVNAAWGLGESVVSGITTPDQYEIMRDTLNLDRKELGGKAISTVRNPETGKGTVDVETPNDKSSRFSLDDAEVRRLGHIGRRVMEYFEGFPQDIEWAYSGGEFYVLQSRPITGVDFSWDEDLEYWQFQKEPENCVYTRAWADEYWNGAITPLHYSYRAKELSDCHYTAQSLYGNPDLAGLRTWKFHKSEAYFASTTEAEWIARAVPTNLRNSGSMNKLPPSWWDETAAAKFSWLDYVKMIARIKAIDDRSAPFKFYDVFNDRIENRRDEANGLTNAELEDLTDQQLHHHILERLEIFKQADDDLWGAFFIYAPFALGLLADLLVRWYDGDIQWAYADLCSGLDKQTITLTENYELWQLGEKMRGSAKIVELLNTKQGADFFATLEEFDEGRDFLAEYRPWVKKRGHRGHADRDSWFPRRADDPMIDYNTFKAILSSPGEDPREGEKRLHATRKAREAEVHEAIRKQPLGQVKLTLFKMVHDYSLRFLEFRDNEREYLDNLTYTQRRCFLVLGQRMKDLGLIEDRDDVWFLGVEENFALLYGHAGTRLSRAKIAARKKNFMTFLAREVSLPNYINPDSTPALPGELIGAVAETTDESGRVIPGAGMSQGTVTGRARVIKNLSDIGTLVRGDILICNSTDPGWTPVFMIISGLVLESGGMLSHGACLSREYGLPAVTTLGAMSKIEDGSIITLDGSRGLIYLDALEAVSA